MYEIAYGGKYERGLDIAEIAKRLRQEIKAAIKAGNLPQGLKTSVRIQRYSGGQSLDIRITALPFNPYNLAWMAWADGGHDCIYVPGNVRRYTEQMEALMRELKRMRDAYNFDGSESQVDYFHVNFYGDVNLDWECDKAWTATAIAQAAEYFKRSGTPGNFALEILKDCPEPDPPEQWGWAPTPEPEPAEGDDQAEPDEDDGQGIPPFATPAPAAPEEPAQPAPARPALTLIKGARAEFQPAAPAAQDAPQPANIELLCGVLRAWDHYKLLWLERFGNDCGYMEWFTIKALGAQRIELPSRPSVH